MKRLLRDSLPFISAGAVIETHARSIPPAAFDFRRSTMLFSFIIASIHVGPSEPLTKFDREFQYNSREV